MLMTNTILPGVLGLQLCSQVGPIGRETKSLLVRRLGSLGFYPAYRDRSLVKESVRAANACPDIVARFHVILFAVQDCFSLATHQEIRLLEGVVVDIALPARL